MKKIIEKYLLSKWWVSILILLLTSYIYVCFLGIKDPQLIKIIDTSFTAANILTILAAIWQFVKGNHSLGAIQIIILIITFFIVTTIASFHLMFGPSTDTFACNLELPKNVELNYPIDLDTANRVDEITLDAAKMNDFIGAEFQLYSSFQPGIYEYDLWLKSDVNGTVYLKAFEITQNIQLSKTRLRDKSTMEIQGTNYKVKRFSKEGHFTIYEGDWGEPYGARFEVWFVQAGTKREFKILEKNYVIEGWMR